MNKLTRIVVVSALFLYGMVPYSEVNLLNASVNNQSSNMLIAQTDDWNDNSTDDWNDNSTDDWNDNSTDDWNDNSTDDWNDNSTDNWSDNQLDIWGGNNKSSSGGSSNVLSDIKHFLLLIPLFFVVLIMKVVSYFKERKNKTAKRNKRKVTEKNNSEDADEEDEDDDDEDDDDEDEEDADDEDEEDEVESNDNKYYVSVKGQEHGPYTFVQMCEFIRENRMNPHTQTRVDGTTEWSDAKEFVEFRNLLKKTNSSQNMYKVRVNGVIHGPYTYSQMCNFIHQGRMNNQTQVMSKKDAQWKAACLYPELMKKLKADD